MNELLSRLLPEEQLLLKLCRLEFTEEQKLEIRELMKSVTDWSYFVRMSNDHGIIALCWYNIVETGNADFILKEHLDILHLGYLKSLARNTKIYTLLDEVLVLAEEVGIKVVLIKGLALEKTIYCDKGLRQMSDLDILVKKEDAIGLRNLLLKNGFVSQPFMSPLHERIMHYHAIHLPAMYKDGVGVEIHFKLFDIEDDHLNGKIYDTAIYLPGYLHQYNLPEDRYHFYYLANHLMKHQKLGESQLRMYTDLIILFLKNPEILLMEQIKEEIKNPNLTNKIREVLIVLSQVCNISIQGKIHHISINEENTIKEFINFLWHPHENNNLTSIESLSDLLKYTEGLNYKALVIIGYIFPSIEYMKERYRTKSRFIATFYYPYRLFNLFFWFFLRTNELAE